MKPKYDFEGWATRNNMRCADGRVIMRDAFAECDGVTVPLVWGHKRDGPFDVLGHALLENKPEGVYAYGVFNDTESGQAARTLVENGDIRALSIFANGLKQQGSNVVHGVIRELSLVLAGANPGAKIEAVMTHGEDEGEAAFMQFVTGKDDIMHSNIDPAWDGEGQELRHADAGEKQEPEKKEEKQAKGTDDETVQDVFDTLTDKQKMVVYAIIEHLMLEKNNEDDEEDDNMKHNAFDAGETNENVLSHDEFMAVVNDAKHYGSLRDSFIAHGIEDVGYLFPDTKPVDAIPSFVQREMGWVTKVMQSVHHTPFSRIRSVHADLTEDDARARGYIKGNQKLDEIFTMLKRVTTPTTVYKKG